MFILKKSWLEKSAKQELHVIFSSAVADPGEGPGEPCPPPPPPYFYAILRPKGPKNFFWRPNPPLSQGMDNRAPSLSEGPLFRDLFRQVRNLDEAGSVTYKMIKMLWIGLTV